MGEQRPIILIVDDEEDMRGGCKQALEKSGYEVFTAKDGDEGAHLARDKKPDVAFVDLKMPGISGTQLIEILSRDSPETVTVMITAYATINSAVDAIKKGAYDYLPKPFTPEQLRILTRRAVEYKRLKEESLRLKNEKERIEKGFITFVSHEMRSPLVVIRQFMESMKMIAADRFDESILEIVDKCERRLKGLEDLVEHWLDINRIEQGTFAQKKDSLSLASVIARSVEEMLPLCQKNSLSLITSIPDDLLKVEGDEESLVRVFTNLIGNATKYTPEGGTITVSARNDGPYVDISVSDTGKGIPSDKLPFIFEAFYRVKGKDEIYRGSGLGLTYCKKIVETHGGQISAFSKEGEGTTVRIRVPGHIKVI